MRIETLHAKLMEGARAAGVAVEDLARAWASIDGRRETFDAGRGKSVSDDETGHYAGYVAEAEEMIRRATKYALERRSSA